MLGANVAELPIHPADANSKTPPRQDQVLQWPGTTNLSDGELLSRFRKYGSRFPEHIPGAFAVALFDSTIRSIIAARDPVGTRPLYYQAVGGRLRVSLSLATFAERRHFDAQVDPRWLAAYIEGIPPEPGSTAFSGVRELLPGELLTVRDGRVQVSRWHTFEAPPETLTDPESALERYRSAVIATADVGQERAAVELGITLSAAALLGAATHGRPPHDGQLWGVGFANFDGVRDLLLADPRCRALAGADVISGWPGRGEMWREWYRAGAKAVGHPAYHADLTVQSLLECTAGAGRSVLIAGAHDSAFGWAFFPPRPGMAAATGRGRRVRAWLGRVARSRLGAMKTSSATQPWTPGPFISPSAAHDLELEQLAADDVTRRAQHDGTGYASLTKDGLWDEWRQRLVTWNQLGRQADVELVFPLYAPEAVQALLALPLDLNDLNGAPGRAAASLVGASAKGIDWHSRRWPGTERPKTADESSTNSQTRRAYLRDNLNPLLTPLLNLDVLGPKLTGANEPAGLDAGAGVNSRRRSLEFAHIEAANHWLDVWGIT